MNGLFFFFLVGLSLCPCLCHPPPPPPPTWTSICTMALIQGGFFSAARETGSRQDNRAKSVTKTCNHIIDSILPCLFFFFFLWSDGLVVWSAMTRQPLSEMLIVFFWSCTGWSFSKTGPRYATFSSSFFYPGHQWTSLAWLIITQKKKTVFRPCPSLHAAEKIELFAGMPPPPPPH